MKRLSTASAILSLLGTTTTATIDYQIANSDSFDTSYPNLEYFEVYSKPIKTLYGQVHWRNHGDIALPDDIVKRFAGGKVMAVRRIRCVEIPPRHCNHVRALR